MSLILDDSDNLRKNEHSVQVIQEMSDTKTIEREHFDEDTEVSDTETIDHSLTNLEEPRSPCQGVLGTTELLEHIISFLPMKKIFTVQRVSKQWRDVVTTSPSIEEKMFLRLKTTPKETCDPRLTGWPYRALQRLGRPVPPTFTLVSLNPELRHDEVCTMRCCGLTCARHGTRVMVRWGPAPIKQCHSLFDTYISDLSCKKADVCLIVRFRKGPCSAPNSAPEYPIKIWVSGITARSESGLTFQDVLRIALNAKEGIECKDDFNFPSKFEHPSELSALRYRTFSWAPNESLREIIGDLPKHTEIPEILQCVLMELKLTLLDDVAAPTPQERAELHQGSDPGR